MTGPEETTSLLPTYDSESQLSEYESDHIDNTGNDPETFSRAGKLTIIFAGLFIIMFQFADILRFAPSMRLFELGYCRQYYLEHNPQLIDAGGNIPEHLCNVGEIQENLSMLKAWLGTLEGAVGLVLVIPYGIVAEFKGGRFVAALNLLGYALSSVWIPIISFFWETLPIKAVIVSPLLRAIGGGAPVTSAVILAIVANAAPTSSKSTMFFFMGAAELLTEIIMPLLSGAFMSRKFLYTPILLGFAFEALALVAIYAIPLDTGKNRLNEENQTDQQPLLSRDEAGKRSAACLSTMVHAASVLTDGKVVVLLGCFSVIRIGRQMLEMLVQYISERFGWSFAQANVAFSIRAAGSLVMLLIILPGTKHVLHNVLRLHANRMDFLLAATSNLFLIIGSLCMGLASTVPIFFLGIIAFTFGSGCRQSLQSLLSSFVERENLNRLYTIVALFDGMGSIMGSLLINGALKQGIHRGAAWLGLPFFIAAGAYTISLTGLLVARR